MAISTNGLQLVRLAGAAFNQQLSASDYSEILAANKTAAELSAWANAAVAAQFKGKTTTDIAKAVLANVGLSAVTGLDSWVAAQLTAGGGVAKAGETLLSLLNDYSNMSTTEAVYGASVATFNTKTANSQVASQTAGTASGTYAAVSAASATDKAAAELVAAQAKLTTASDTAAAAAATAIAAATVADTALTAAQTAQTAAAAKAALTDATVLTATTKTLTDASTVAATAKTVADAAVVTATTALTATLNVATPVASDVVTANANVIIATAKAAAAATAATTAATAAGLAKTASDAATADDVAAVTAQTALNTAATAATTAAAASVTAAAASKVAATATTATTDDTVAASAATAAAATGAGAAKITADAAAKVISDAAAKVISDAAAKVISDAAAKVIADAAAKEITDAAALKVITDAAKVTADALALTLVAKPFTLTTGVDVSTGGAGADTYSATHLTIGASDILAGGAGIDTLKIIDTGTAAFAVPAARVSGFETISIQNINLVPAVAVVTGVNEAATIQFKALSAGHTVIIAGITFTAGTGGATAAQVAAAFADPLTAMAEVGATIATANTFVVNGGALTGGTFATTKTIAEAAVIVDAVFTTNLYNPTAGTAIVDSTVFTSTGNTNVVDLVATGTAVTGQPQITKATVVSAGGGLAIGTTFTVTVNGSTLAVAALAGGDAATLLLSASTNIAAAINAFIGSTVATAALGVVTITSPTPISVGTPVASTATLAVTTMSLFQGYIAPAAPTITIVARTAANAGSSAAATADTVTVTNFTDATSFVSDASIGAVTFSGDLTATQSVTLKGNGAMIVGGLTATFGAAATTPVFNISGGTKGTAGTAALNTINVGSNTTNVTVNSTDETNIVGALTVVGGRADGTLTVNASTALTTGVITSDAKNLIVTGAATNPDVGGTSLVTLGTLTMGNLTNIDASGMTVGGVSLTLPTSVLTFKGGQGNDSVTSATIASTAVIDAGLGRDTLILAANITSSAVGAQYTNFETLRVVAAATQNVALVSGITAVQVQSGANAITGLTAVQAAAVTARGSIAASTFALTDSTGTADVFSMTLGQGTTTNSPASLTGALTLTGFETVNLTAVAGPAVAAGAGRVSTIASFDDISANTINLRGTAFTITDLANATGTRAKVLTVDGSALVGNGDTTNVGLTASGNIFAGSTVIGSATADNNFTLGTEIAVTYTGGAGKDSFTGSSAQIAAQTINGGAGNDTLVINDGADTIANATFAKVTNMEFLTLNEVAALSLTTGTAFNTAFTSGAATISATALDNSAVTVIDSSAYTGNTTLTVTTAADAEATTLTTGAGNDIVAFTGRNTTGAATISTGDGNDRISVTHGTGTLATTTTGFFVITPGAGADTVTLTVPTRGASLSNVFVNINGGDSPAAGFDKITGFLKGGGGTATSDTLNFTGSSIKPVDGFAATTVSGFTAAQLQVAASTAGLLTFTGTSATSLTEAQIIAAYTSTVDAKLNNLETVVFSSATDTYVFNNNLLGDSVVMLVGVTGITAVGAAATTANLIGIA